MSDKCIAVCPKCYGWYTVSVNQPARCPQCGAVLKVLDVDYDEYCSMSEEEKAEFGERCFAALGQETKKKPKRTKKVKRIKKTKSVIKDSDVWINLLETICIIIVSLALLIGIVGFGVAVLEKRIGFGVVFFAAVLLIGMLAVAQMMVFLGMAHDLRGIRNILESSMSDEE